MQSNDFEFEAVGPHFSQNKNSASKLRRGGKHCPLCLAPLTKNAGRTRVLRACVGCQAHVSRAKFCVRCGQESIWENKHGAACQTCGLHGAKIQVIAPSVSK